ncbi:MAG TPA: MBL fold metallo-hydrolase [Planctomycetaceae bacterium]|nr:MBL fold metallo-hydrolase [Planctomycetaceae bacterium]
MRLGDFDLTILSGGRYRIDAGTMFGVVPRVLWQRVFPPTDDNTIPQATNCVLVEGGGRRVLIDTGYGPKLSEKQRSIFQAEPGDPLAASLAARGLAPEDIDTVILSHLHFDHAGGATRRADDGRLMPAFPNAEYVAQRLEWVTATAEFPELLAAYPLDNLLPLRDSGQLRLIDGDVEIVPGIRSLVTGGHTAGHMAVVIDSGGETAVYLADLCPSWRHLATLWCMSYDVDLLQVRRMKPNLLGQIADQGWLALVDHDPDHAAARLRRDDRRDFAVAEFVC